MSSPMYFRVNMGSMLRDRFPPHAVNLLLAKQEVWNRLVGRFNLHIQYLREQITLQYPQVSEALAASKPQSAQWFEAIKDARKLIRDADVDLNAGISDILSGAPIWWQNKDELYADFIRAVRTNKYRLKPLRTRHDKGGFGSFNYRFQHPVTMGELLQGELPVKITQEGRFASLVMPIHASSHGQYVTLEVPFTIHRDLSDRHIHGIKLICRKEGAVRRTVVSFLTSLRRPTECTTQHAVVAALDVGWRITGSGMRVATACFDDDYFEELVLPSAWILDMDYLVDLGRHITELAVKHAHLHHVPAPRSWLSIAEFDAVWDIWGKQTQSMRNEFRNKLAKLTRERLDIYHQFSARLANAADVIVIENLNLKAMLLPGANQGPEQKRQQKMAAITVLQNTLENACRKRGKKIEKVKAYNSSTIHVGCGHKNSPSKTNDITCKGCGQHYDQDRNAALMLNQNYQSEASSIVLAPGLLAL